MDLVEERQEVIQTLLQAGCIPAGMELFPASDDEKWALIRRVIDECDYYVLVIGGRYGSRDPVEGVSYTEMEYDYAVSQHKPVMAFLHGSPGEIAVNKSEMDQDAQLRLGEFRSKAEQKMVKYWSTASDLGGQVAKSLISLRQSHPAEGWVRAEFAMTPETEAEIATLRAKVSELTADLGEARRQGPSGSHRTDQFAQGDDRHEIEVILRYLPKGNRYNDKIARYYASPTWDELFAVIAPTLIDEGADDEIKAALDNAAPNLLDEDFKLPEDFAQSRRTSVASNLVDDVKVQFLAIGLIQRSDKKHTASDKNSYWSLTPDGHDRMLAVRAVRRPGAEDGEELSGS